MPLKYISVPHIEGPYNVNDDSYKISYLIIVLQLNPFGLATCESFFKVKFLISFISHNPV